MKTLVTSNMMIERDGEEIDINIDGYVWFTVDRNYGADADGNRGIVKLEVKDIYDVRGYFENLSDANLTQHEIDQACERLFNQFSEEGR